MSASESQRDALATSSTGSTIGIAAGHLTIDRWSVTCRDSPVREGVLIIHGKLGGHTPLDGYHRQLPVLT